MEQQKKDLKWLDKVENSQDTAKIAVMLLKKGNPSVASHLDKLNLEEM